MLVDDFDFDLPEERIALRPARPRDTARLLTVGPATGERANRRITDLPDQLLPGDLVVFNDTRVIPAQLYGVRSRADTSARIEVLLHQKTSPSVWKVFARPAKRLRVGDRIVFSETFSAQVHSRKERESVLAFNLSGVALDEAIATHGTIPLPPYITAKRNTDARDQTDYQTLFADRAGAVAAPTAGLHFTPALLRALQARGIESARITLHVGAGTFSPVSVKDTGSHQMHSEWGEVSIQTARAIEKTRARGGRIVAIGTTTLRLLESAARETGHVRPWSGETDIFIEPGFVFRAVNILLTNFHLPRSTLFMLVSAFRSLPEMQAVYRYAIHNQYRFYSYGDACLLYGKDTT